MFKKAIENTLFFFIGCCTAYIIIASVAGTQIARNTILPAIIGNLIVFICSLLYYKGVKKSSKN